MKKISLNELILNSANTGINIQNKDGSMPKGHNGPWNHQDTPVRNTANWLKSFLFAYKKTGDRKYIIASQRALDYLLSTESRPHNATFYCRANDNKNKSNGLIGQAWVLEALTEIYKIMKDDKILRIIEEVFLLHRFDSKKGLWHEMNIDGSVKGLCNTYNQQLWFAAIGAKVKSNNLKIKKRTKKFIENLEKNTYLYNNGLIKHRFPRNSFLGKVKKLFKETIKSEEKELSIGYHSFNLYGLGLLKQTHPELSFWKSKKFKKILEYTQSSGYKKALDGNKYGFPYNVTGIEVAYALQSFVENSEKLQKKWIEEQLKRHYDFNSNLMNKNTDDPEILSARIYEATRLKNINLFDENKKQ